MCCSRVLCVFSACVFLLVTFNLGSSAQTFSRKDYSAAVLAPDTLSRADLNHDGYADIVNAGGTDIFVLLNNGDGTFRSPVSYPAGGRVGKTMIADVNGDTHPDIIYSTLDLNFPDFTGHISLLYGNGDGTYGSSVPFLRNIPVLQAQGFDLSDFNRDGKIDLVVGFTVTESDKHLSIFFGDGTSFSNPIELTQIGKTSDSGTKDFVLQGVVTGDFNGDGNPDIAIGESNSESFNPQPGSYSVFYGKGDGTFGPEVFEGEKYALYAIKPVNVNNDGMTDLAVYFDSCIAPCRGIDLIYGDKAGLNHGSSSSKVPPFDGPEAPNPDAILFTDVNGDGRPDVIAAGIQTQEDGSRIPAISVNLQQQDGNFARAKLINMNAPMADLVAGDFNHDGKWDFISSSPTSGTISVFTNTTVGIGCAYPGSNRRLTVCLPKNGSRVTSPVLFRANASATAEISGLKIYVDGVSKFFTQESPLTARVVATPGTHRITVRAWDAIGPFSRSLTIKVRRDRWSPCLFTSIVAPCLRN